MHDMIFDDYEITYELVNSYEYGEFDHKNDLTAVEQREMDIFGYVPTKMLNNAEIDAMRRWQLTQYNDFINNNDIDDAVLAIINEPEIRNTPILGNVTRAQSLRAAKQRAVHGIEPYVMNASGRNRVTGTNNDRAAKTLRAKRAAERAERAAKLAAYKSSLA